MKEVVAGIKEEELSALSIEVLDYADRISEIFNRIDSCMDRLPAYYRGEPCKKILERYNTLQASYSAVKSNLTSYSDDFTMLIQKMREGDEYLNSLFEGFTDDTNNKIRTEQFSLR